MKLIEIIREPCVLCPKTAGIVSESECQKCEHQMTMLLMWRDRDEELVALEMVEE